MDPEVFSVQSPLTLVKVIAPVPEPPLVVNVKVEPKVALVELVILKALWLTLEIVKSALS